MVRDPATWNEIGHLIWEARRASSGNVRTKPDSGLPGSLVAGFHSVHDDLAPGGSERDTREDFFGQIAEVKESGLDFFAHAGHGGKRSLPSAAVRGQDRERLAHEIRRLVKPDGVVISYACETAALRGALSQGPPRFTGPARPPLRSRRLISRI